MQDVLPAGKTEANRKEIRHSDNPSACGADAEDRRCMAQSEHHIWLYKVPGAEKYFSGTGGAVFEMGWTS
jgi:hypothetical protein